MYMVDVLAHRCCGAWVSQLVRWIVVTLRNKRGIGNSRGIVAPDMSSYKIPPVHSFCTVFIHFLHAHFQLVTVTMGSIGHLNIPKFDDLPPVKGMPQGCAWGIFDKDGKKDYLGCLNLLTPAVVQAALREARDGESVSLNWPINAIHKPGFSRAGLQHKVISFQDTAFKAHGFDDEVTFNTQCSSQWDSLVHFAHQASGTSYNGVKPSREDLIQANTPFDKNTDLPTLNHWHERGGLVGRGVLVDYAAYAEAHGIKYSPFDSHKITIEDLEAVAQWEGLEFNHGDILIVRSGFTRGLQEARTPEKQQELMSSHRTVGVEGSTRTARWVWDHHFAAVAGDAIAFEQIPPVKEDGTECDIRGLGEYILVESSILTRLLLTWPTVLHEYFLGMFGLNIGELWDLEKLSETCARKQKYSFLLTSCPLNVPGGVGSPPNALAIF